VTFSIRKVKAFAENVMAMGVRSNWRAAAREMERCVNWRPAQCALCGARARGWSRDISNKHPECFEARVDPGSTAICLLLPWMVTSERSRARY
jgi:hypothetical protein